MKKIHFAIIFLAFACCAMMPQQASAEDVVAGMPCKVGEIGKTVIDKNSQNIVACLKTDDQTCQVWKAMTMPAMPKCAENELVSGTSDGTLVCMKMVCRLASYENLSAANYVSTVQCNSNEFLLNGGGITHPNLDMGACPYHRIGILHTSRPTDDLKGWNADAFGFREWPSLDLTAPASEACARAYATCCHWEQTD